MPLPLTLLSDLRLAWRTAFRHRGYAGLVLAIQSVGIAATTVMFGLVYGALFRPLPFPQSERLMMLYRTADERDGRGPVLTRWSYPRYRSLQRSNRSFVSVASFGRADFNLGGADGDPERVAAEIVAASYTSTLEVSPPLGRGFAGAEDSLPGTAPVALVSDGLWSRRFGRDPAIIGRPIRVNGETLTVIGVMPAGFRGLTGRADLWVPETMAPKLSYRDHLTTPQNFISVVGRLRPDRDRPAAEAELAVIGDRVAKEWPDEVDVPTAWSAALVPLADARIDPTTRRSVLALFGAVSLLLVLAATNVAGLGLVRMAGRRRELLIRHALGASRFGLIRLVLVESAGLGIVAGAIGAIGATIGFRLIGIPRSLVGPGNQYGAVGGFSAPSMDLVVLAFAAALSLGASLLAGVWPAIAAARAQSGEALRGAPARRFRGPSGPASLVVVEIALALVLSLGAGLLVGSLERLRRVPLGIDPEGVLTFRIEPSDVRYGPKEAPALLDRVLDAVRAVPGVRSVTVDACTPLGTTCANSTLYVVGRPLPRPEQAPFITRHYVGPDHFVTLGIPLLGGRPFTPADRAGAARVTIINQTAARRFWPGENPLGQRVWFGGGSSFDRPDSAATIVGVVGDVPYGSLETAVPPSFYTPYSQFTYAFRTVMVRTAGDPLGLAPAIRQAVRGVDDLPIFEVRSLRDRLDDSLASTRFNAMSFTAFALVALLLAAGGVYAVVAQSVSLRLRELAVRFALGARAGDVVLLVVRHGLALGLVGVAIGTAAALALGRVIRGLLFGAQSASIGLFAAEIGLLLAVALGASLIPAFRAARVDPAAILRAD
jgi:predicted permease